MVDIVQKHGVKFNYGTQRRYMPIYRKVRELVDAGEIGDVQCSIAQYGASSALWGLTHAADMLLFLAGDPEVDFVQGAIICNDSDWDGNRLNVDPRYRLRLHPLFQWGSRLQHCRHGTRVRSLRHRR